MVPAPIDLRPKRAPRIVAPTDNPVWSFCCVACDDSRSIADCARRRWSSICALAGPRTSCAGRRSGVARHPLRVAHTRLEITLRFTRVGRELEIPLTHEIELLRLRQPASEVLVPRGVVLCLEPGGRHLLIRRAGIRRGTKLRGLNVQLDGLGPIDSHRARIDVRGIDDVPDLVDAQLAVAKADARRAQDDGTISNRLAPGGAWYEGLLEARRKDRR